MPPESHIPVPGDATHRAESARIAELDALIRVDEVANAEFYVGDLFRRRFGGDPPDYPRHFVALYKAARNNFVAVGFIHYMTFEDMALLGGMIEDERALRRMPAAHQAIVNDAGGLAAKLLRDTLPRLKDLPALWVQAGDEARRELLRHFGFTATDDAHLMVKWNRELAKDEQDSRLARIRALGLF
jgi:hypothetical protein